MLRRLCRPPTLTIPSKRTFSRMSSSGFQELLGGVEEVLQCAPTSLEPVSLSERLVGKKFALVYFSANWCGPCRRFTPLLSEWYAQVRDDVEIIFASSCDDAGAFDTYAKAKHPWLALPYDVSQGGIGYIRAAKREATGMPNGTLATLCDVSSVPTLGVFDTASGKLISKNGRHDISSEDNGPDGEPPYAAYGSAAAILQKWTAQQHSWLTPMAAATGAMVVEPATVPSLLTSGALAKAAHQSQLFVLLVAAADPETGQSWCPDCVAVRGPLENAFAQLPSSAAVVEASITREEVLPSTVCLHKLWALWALWAHITHITHIYHIYRT